MEIDSAPDPFKEDWDKTVVSWYNVQEADVYLTMAGIHDTLTLGSGQGLYCLLNIGDNNTDGKDEIAFVVDYCDNSRVNDCRIYSLCNGKWTMLLEFGVHEDAFNFTSDTIPYFSEIPDFLVKQNGAWVYKDYRQDGWDKPEDVGAFKKISVSDCNR